MKKHGILHKESISEREETLTGRTTKHAHSYKVGVYDVQLFDLLHCKCYLNPPSYSVNVLRGSRLNQPPPFSRRLERLSGRKGSRCRVWFLSLVFQALEEMNGKELEGENIEIVFAKPPDQKRKERKAQRQAAKTQM